MERFGSEKESDAPLHDKGKRVRLLKSFRLHEFEQSSHPPFGGFPHVERLAPRGDASWLTHGRLTLPPTGSVPSGHWAQPAADYENRCVKKLTGRSYTGVLTAIPPFDLRGSGLAGGCSGYCTTTEVMTNEL